MAWLRSSIEANRNHPLGQLCLAAALARLGWLYEAKAAARAALTLNPSFTIRRVRAQRTERQSDLPRRTRAHHSGHAHGWGTGGVMMSALVHLRPSEPLSPTLSCPLCTEGDLIVLRRRKRRRPAQVVRAHSGNPAFRRPSISNFEVKPLPRAIPTDIVKSGSSSSRRAAASRASASRPACAKADARTR